MPVATDTLLSSISFIFTPEGFIPDGALCPDESTHKRWLSDGGFPALYEAALRECPASAGASARFLYRVADAFWHALTALPELELLREKAEATLSGEDAERLLAEAPFVPGAEYLSEAWLRTVFAGLNRVFAREMAGREGTVALYLAEKSQNLRVPERVFFHLVENKSDESYPFAFLATYATQDADGNVRHVPLQYALTEYSEQREKLLSLLACLNRAAEVSPLIGGFMQSGELLHPLRLTAQEAWAFLKQIEAIEQAGILCRIPNWWRKRAATVSVSLRLGEKKPSLLGFDALISVQPQLTVDGMPLTKADIRQMLAQTEGLAFLKGKWVEVDHARLQKLLAEAEQGRREVTLSEALRMSASAQEVFADVGTPVSNGKWLSGLLQQLRKPEELKPPAVPDTVHAILRPYQKQGYAWLTAMSRFGFGACLADDMGLGKTVQVLTWLEHMRRQNPQARFLLIVPTSLLSNWQKEAERFVPSMPLQILHGKTAAVTERESGEPPAFLTVTTYGMAARIKELQSICWDGVILDEAQAIKNPAAAQTREIKKLNARMRIALTGTPIENDLTNLWSLFDFLDKGLLGTAQEFRKFTRGIPDHPERYGKLRAMVSPFLLRRLKTDKRVIADLPEKLETQDYITLTRKQIVLYRKVVADLEEQLQTSEGIQRRGLVLASIIKLKQICNHPDQYLGQSAYAASESGKFAMLRELCETIYEKRERVLVFTQFREITDALAGFLEEIFRQPGYVLHGGTPTKKRGQIVDAFQGESYVPFLVLSVKAGGTGLNLTKANHVIHFDRWWNPAVENQATDRAFRIGQTKNVMVHKLICKGTVEEKIDRLIEDKKALAENVIGSGDSPWITELDNDELLHLLRLEDAK